MKEIGRNELRGLIFNFNGPVFILIEIAFIRFKVIRTKDRLKAIFKTDNLLNDVQKKNSQFSTILSKVGLNEILNPIL